MVISNLKNNIQKLVDKLDSIDETYDDKNTSRDFIHPFFEELGWDFKTDVKQDKSENSPGSAFQIDNVTRFYLKEFPITSSLESSKEDILSLMSYAYNKGVTWAIATNFKETRVYNTESTGRTLASMQHQTFLASEYIEKFEYLLDLTKKQFSLNVLDSDAEYFGKKPKRIPIDKQLLQDLLSYRNLLVSDIIKENSISDKDASQAAQKILNRFIFIRSCGDKKIEDRYLQSSVRNWEENKNKKLIQHLQEIFSYFRGRYGSTLFEKNDFDDLIINDLTLVNVIDGLYQSKQKAVQYNFAEIEHDTLGKIYENYLGTIQQKKDGAYYTPSYISKYICENTIIPHLSKSNITNIPDLVSEYSDNLEELESKIHNIKILDPACGTGEFLIRAIDILLEISKEIQIQKEAKGNYTHTIKGKKSGSIAYQTFDKDVENQELRKIIHNNIHGVDINEEAIEIAHLNLFLKLATSSQQLMDVSKNIRIGNSLIDDKSVDPIAFEWKKEFPEKLDVVIGNPPYFNMDTLGANSPYANSIKKNYPKVWNDKTDILIYFITKSLELSKNKLGFIISNAFLFSEKANKFRNYLLENSSIIKIINFEKFHVFENANITTSIILLDKDTSKTNTRALVLAKKMYDESQLKKIFVDDELFFDVQLRKDSVFALVNNKIDKINSKIDSAGTPLGELFRVGSGMQPALNSVFVMNNSPTDFPPDFIKKRISGDIIQPYHIGEPNEFCLYVENVESFDDLPLKIREYLNSHKEDLSNRADKKRRKSAKWWNYAFPMHKELYHLDKIWCSYRRADNCFVYDNTGEYVGLTNTTVIFGTNENISLQYVISLLNSTLLNFRYQSIGKQTGGGLYEYFENGVSKLPIPNINSEEQEVFISKSSKISKHYFEFYDKQKKFITRLIAQYGIKINSQLEKFYEMNFEDFYRELSKQNIDIHNEQQEDLENYFVDRKKSLLGIQEKIFLLLEEIDVLVFKLYGISKEEREIIRANISRY